MIVFNLCVVTFQNYCVAYTVLACVRALEEDLDLDVHPAHMRCLRRAHSAPWFLHSLPRAGTMGTPLIKTTEHSRTFSWMNARPSASNSQEKRSACKSAAAAGVCVCVRRVLSSVKICYNNLSDALRELLHPTPIRCGCRHFLALATPAFDTFIWPV